MLPESPQNVPSPVGHDGWVQNEDRRPKTEDRRPKTEDRRPKTEDRRPKTEDRRPKTEDRRPKTQKRRPLQNRLEINSSNVIIDRRRKKETTRFAVIYEFDQGLRFVNNPTKQSCFK